MSKLSKLGLRRAMGAGALAAVAAFGLGAMGAGDAAALANGYKKASGLDGESIQTWRQGEAAFPVKSQANNGAGRAAEVSGVYTAKGVGGANGSMEVGYLIGCQVDITGFSGGLGGSLALTGVANLSGSLSIPLKPGQVAYQRVTSKSFKENGSAAVQLSRFQIDVQQCGGYASARSVVITMGGKGFEVNSDDATINAEGAVIKSTLYGQPFSLG